MQKLKQLDWEGATQEKEYYFDENVGVSLNEHIDTLKK